MQTIHAILALHQPLFGELLSANLSRERDIRIVSQVEHEFEIAASLHDLLDDREFAVDDPVIVVTSLEDVDNIPPSVSRLLVEFPEVTIIGICWATSSVRSFQLQIDVREVPCSLTGLIDAIRECANRGLSW
ncbi:MAG: hypothetical protein WCJ09_29100 [Planctomycetota bacterium]